MTKSDFWQNVVFPSGSPTIGDSAGIVLAGGTTAQRSDTPVNGTLRYNTEFGLLESYESDSWLTVRDKWITITDTYTAQGGDRILVDTTVKSFTITLTPSEGAVVYLFDRLSTWTSHNLIVDGGGATIEGQNQTLTCNVPVEVKLICTNSNWRIFTNQGPPGEQGLTGPAGNTGKAFFSPTSVPSLSAQAYTTTLNDLGKTLQITTGASNATVTLIGASATGVEDGNMMAIRKVDAGAGKLTVTDGTTTIAILRTQHDSVLVRTNLVAWRAQTWKIKPFLSVITTTQSFAIDPLATRLRVIGTGGGSGGGSGRVGADGSARWGGGGGSGGGWVENQFLVSNITSPVTCTIGAGGAGGAAVATSDTNGNPGIGGGDTSFGTYMMAKAGNGGAGGTTTSGTGGIASSSTSTVSLVLNGSSSSVTAIPSLAGTSPIAPSSGGAGGGISTANVEFAGGGASQSSAASPSTTSGGAGGSTSGGVGGNGLTITDYVTKFGGSGAGGGGSSRTSNAGKGGDGGAPGGGGGGGGAALNSFSSGAGGSGGRGELRIYTYFD